ncbi:MULTISPECIES: hypothetical protein [unclassified Granulicatella]|uniref:hypothetical protein n=1 Tax=unclassified Granulicatella TaxID=2630493 RepID=UPI0010736FC6|nr:MULTISPECIES: hypothetical protein [unclassified Granulicatella]MBF0779883.1 hypothetical protein [Granulicatella sp. 19428wC4_WM01]TFU96087.1 hypothetical protein E4T68_02125 [Granulicatella sp. WM01]
MNSRLKKNHPEYVEEQNVSYEDETIRLSPQDFQTLETLQQPNRPTRKGSINRFLTIGIIVELILLALILFIAFKK